jgi:hypothetical protein
MVPRAGRVVGSTEVVSNLHPLTARNTVPATSNCALGKPVRRFGLHRPLTGLPVWRAGCIADDGTAFRVARYKITDKVSRCR